MNNYTIELPEGFVIDTEKSTDTKIVVKAVIEEQKTECKTYEEIQAYNSKLGKTQFFISSLGHIMPYVLHEGVRAPFTSNHVPSKEIAEKMIALCQLYIMAEYYNDGWVPDWDNNSEKKFFASYSPGDDIAEFSWSWNYKYGIPVFKSSEILEEAYKHNKEIFKKALSI